jgi:dimethylglycine dehydrogenase
LGSTAPKRPGLYGYTLQASIALAYVRADLATPGTEVEIEIDILGQRRTAVVAEEPIYDPTNARLRA